MRSRAGPSPSCSEARRRARRYRDLVDADALRARIDAVSGDGGFSGVVLAWVDGAPLFSHATGFAHRGHGVPNTALTRFGVASITKIVTAATALRMVDQGRLDLAVPLVDFVDASLLPQHVSPALTTHHLLSHTSGLAGYYDDELDDWSAFTGCWDAIPTYHVRQPRDLLPLFAGKEPFAEPGGSFRYSDANYILAGIVLEHVTGQPFGDLATQEVLAPAGMSASAFTDLDADPPGLAVGYLPPSGDHAGWRSNIYSVPAASMPDGGMITTAADLDRLIDGLRLGVLLSDAGFAAMLTPHAEDNQEPGLSYGYGMKLSTVDGRVVRYGHGGSDPGVNATVRHYVDRATTIAVLANVDLAAEPTAADVADIVAAEMDLTP